MTRAIQLASDSGLESLICRNGSKSTACCGTLVRATVKFATSKWDNLNRCNGTDLGRASSVTSDVDNLVPGPTMVPTTSGSPCELNPCSLNETCQPNFSFDNSTSNTTANSLINYTCHPGAKAVNLENSVNPVEKPLDVALVAGVSCAVILVLCILVGCGFLILRRTKNKRRHHGTYSPSREEQSGGRRMELCHVLKPPPIERLI